ncbi:CHS1 [Mytilus edulis]|uniref:chitin synthase n=1 Tax=Mytilus edulis TaxID=6550 RepID=A0A8S3SJE1_MYTED|nr:CHS1 [Mytilus edulis]
MTIRPCDIPSSGYHGDDLLLNSFLIHFSTSIGLFYGAVISTRLGMDKICFCITLAIGTPVYLIALVVSKFKYETNWISRTLMSKEVNFTEIWIMIVMFFIAWASQLWTCRYIWYSSHDRMALVSRLFVLPHYCSPIADLSLLHSRRHKRIHNSNDRQEDDSGVTNVYICATMWHENRREMKQFIKTLFRLDMDQADRRETKKNGSASDREAAIRDCYEFEAHIMFDDAMETTGGKDGKEKKREPNEFVQQLMEIISEAMMTDYQETTNLTTLVKRVTPYGGRLEWTLRGENKLYVHLKDKLKIRHKKRWSQIMYLYYLIGYKLVNTELKNEKDVNDFRSAPDIFENFPRSLYQKESSCHSVYSPSYLQEVGYMIIEYSYQRSSQLLLDRMKKNTKVGATCGRIKPGGSGPVVWYQKFEYAIGHWLQKSAEHVFGCVLCSPGCFSLFRAKALMDDNIMRTYANVPTEPKHYIQYDQGEDRWLCTLLLQQGYRIEYCAAAEALTFAPEDFREFSTNEGDGCHLQWLTI